MPLISPTRSLHENKCARGEQGARARASIVGQDTVQNGRCEESERAKKQVRVRCGVWNLAQARPTAAKEKVQIAMC